MHEAYVSPLSAPARLRSRTTLDAHEQLTLDGAEDTRYLREQLITYIGNKRALLEPIRAALETVCQRTGRRRLRVLDAFSGSGVVSRLLKQYSSDLHVNDIEDYARVVSQCYLTNRSTVNISTLSETIRRLDERVRSESVPPGFIVDLYAPKDEAAIQLDDRVFYTRQNAYRLDAYRQLLDDLPAQERVLLLGPLLSAASIHANTAGVFKGFYKNRATGIGKFGGTGADALSRILAPVSLRPPVLSSFECDFIVHQQDATDLVSHVGALDVAYLDPPYNQHPYGSNYFMLNLLVNYQRPSAISRVSGIPTDWRRSDYNVRSLAMPRFRQLVEAIDAAFLIVSFNDEGFIAPSVMRNLLSSVGRVTEHRQPYSTFRGCRNLRNRPTSVTEHVYLVEKG